MQKKCNAKTPIITKIILLCGNVVADSNRTSLRDIGFQQFGNAKMPKKFQIPKKFEKAKKGVNIPSQRVVSGGKGILIVSFVEQCGARNTQTLVKTYTAPKEDCEADHGV